MDFSMPQVDWQRVIGNVAHIGLAWALALPIALDRERRTHIMGLRTFPLVAMGACAYILIALDFVGDTPDPKARIIQGLLVGIGFFGAGAIIQDGDRVRGTASAASIFTVVAMAAAVAFRVYEIAFVLAAANFFTLRFLNREKDSETNTEDGDEP